MILIIIKFVTLAILILLDFIIYLSPSILSLIIKLITTLIWYFPSIYQLYSFIFTREYDLKARIYLLIYSPIIIILYIPFFVIYSIGHFILFLFIIPLIVIIRRPGYPLYSISLTAAIAYTIYNQIYDCSIEGLLIDPLIREKIRD